MYRKISEDEYDHTTLPILEAIFDQDIYGTVDNPFINKSWEVILLGWDLFYMFADESRLTKKSKIETVRIYKKIFQYLQARNIREIIICSTPCHRPWKGESYTNFAAIIPTSSIAESIQDLRNKERDFKSASTYAICDDTKRWGYISTHDGFSCLAGEADFIEGFHAFYGGRDAVRQYFYDFDASDAWVLAYDNTGGVPAVGANSTREYAYYCAGWEPYVYTEQDLAEDPMESPEPTQPPASP
ncbi:hypothetical protein [Insolitispirillum peregrinum]|uniref:Uncharacterized protein n=1 Tax=Insolitispirillum peregrinum TaxID=80876 RepID=A0A1N7IRT6_9PROT|nr:hypothetical protein [Insolitispirillum peregrinum]SIS39691.1 hypothetical protein SAMN05421779_101525 [Insolitispirillum peregrinum]